MLRFSVRRQRLLLGPLALAVLQLGCTDPGLASGLARTESPIVNGEPDDIDRGVVHLQTPSGACSGSLIAPNIILTALHCVSETPGGSFTCDAEGNLSSSTGMAGTLGALLDPTRVQVRTGLALGSQAVAHGVKLFGTGSLSTCRNDLAVMVIDTELDEPIVPLRYGTPTKRGEAARAVGYGSTESDADAGAPESGRRARYGLTVQDVGDDGITEGSRYAAPYTVVVGEGPCHGDSGGPLLSEETGAAFGVYSILLSSQCKGTGIRNAYTQVAPFEGTIQKAFDYAGGEPVLEGSGTGGGAGATGQAGEPGGGGEPGAEAGAGGEATALGGTGGSRGGATSTGGDGSGATGGSSAAGGTGGSSATGGSGAESQGSGSRHDPSCACRTGGGSSPGSASALSALLLGLGLVLRRRRA